MSEEVQCREIVGYEDYLIYSDGRVFGKKRGRFLNPSRMKRGGYYQYDLCNKGIRKNFLVHRLVALHYIANNEEKECVEHLDGDTSNNDFRNLRWVSRSERHHTSPRAEAGVSWHESANKWRVLIKLNECSIYIGYFEDLDIANQVSRTKRE